MTALRIFLRQFANGFFYILIAAALISFFLGEHLDTMVITTILFVNAFLGFIQEYRSQKLLEKLESLIDQKVKVRRDNQIVVISQKDLQHGDIVIIESGDRIPADLTITNTHLVQTDESSITGESLPVSHDVGDKLLMGSSVVDGLAEGKVIALSRETEFGKIRSQAMQISTKSQFEKDVDVFSKKLMIVVLATLGALLVAHLLFGRSHLSIPTLLLFILALAIGIVPEAMPLVTALAMTSGAVRLARQKVVVKKLAAVEDLGNIVVLCTDKTGTVTEGNMAIADRLIAHPQSFELACLISMGKVGVGNQGVHNPFDHVIWKSLPEKIRAVAHDIDILWEDPFDPQTRKTEVVAKIGKDRWAISKGAPESMLPDVKNGEQFKRWATSQGLLGRRVLVIAGKKFEKKTQYAHEDFSGSEMLGLLSFSDPLKLSAKDAIADAKKLGVDVRLITGDSPEVAFVVGRELGMIHKREEVLTGQDLEKLSPGGRTQTILKTKVFARVYPSQKQEIVNTLSSIGPVGFVGDGVNDAPALRAATVGIAADHATDVAREAASIILLKKDLHVIIDGIRKGREIFINIEKYLIFTLIGDFGTFYSIAAISLVTTFLPMLPVQILLSNLLSDFPMVSIAADNVDDDHLVHPVHSQFNRVLVFSLVLGLVSSIFDFVLFGLFRSARPELLQTLWFVFSVITELVLIFSVRTQRWIWVASRPASILVVGALVAGALTILLPLSPFGHIFHFVRPPISSWITLFALTLIYFGATEGAKRVFLGLAPHH